MIDRLQEQIDDLVKGRRVEPVSAEQFLITLVGSCLFPFAARPMICAVLQLDDRGYDRFMKQRAATLAQFFLDALRP